MDESNPEATTPGAAPTVLPMALALPPAPVYAMPVPPRAPKSPGLALFLSFLFPEWDRSTTDSSRRRSSCSSPSSGPSTSRSRRARFPSRSASRSSSSSNLIDAYRSAVLINEQRRRQARLAPEEEAMESPLWGASLAVGVLALLNNMGWLRMAALARYWPLALIATGGVFLYQSLNRRKNDRTPPGGRDAFLS